MKTVRLTVRRGWLVAVIGVLGIIGGARLQVWAGSIPLPQGAQCSGSSENACVLPASFK